jgi:two-component system, response regulator PdtaR
MPDCHPSGEGRDRKAGYETLTSGARWRCAGLEDCRIMDRTPKETGRVLVVEDEFLVALGLSSMIEDTGWAVLGPGPSVEKALSVIARSAPVPTFLDENLDSASVAPVVQVRARRRIPFAVLSGYARLISGDPLLREARRI